jgi:crotonobetainyl-CoA:carnitine CoA-transferase CaiB-like acyl-CoA transferase
LDTLRGLFFLDLAETVAGSYCAKLMADQGAQVLKVEAPKQPDPLRPRGSSSTAKAISQFANLNTAKSSRTLDIRRPNDLEAFLKLVEHADAVIEDREPGWVARAGAGFDAMARINPRVVLTSITPFGQSGPYQDYKANDLLLQAMGSRMAAAGIAPRPPVRLAPDTSLYLAGTLAAGATLAAIWAAKRDGIGDHIDISVLETLLGAPDRGLLMWEYGKVDLPRPSSPRVLQNFPCSDGFIAISTVRGIERIAKAIGRQEILEDPRLASNEGRQANSGELEAIISAWTCERTRLEAFRSLQDCEVICAPVNTVADLFTDPQFQHRQAFQDVKFEEVSLKLPGKPFREPGVPPSELKSPRTLGKVKPDKLVLTRSSHDELGADLKPLELPLSGIRVIDFGDAWAGPYACTLLGDAGAEVIRIEDIHRMPANMRGRRNPGTGGAGYVDRTPGERPWDRFYLYNGCERNKMGVTLDLKQQAGRELFLQLVAQSDVVISNFAHGALASLRLEYSDLREVNPDLVMLYISGYGSDGPYANYVALGPTIDAASGHQSLRGYPETAPADSAHTYYPDVVASYTAFFAVMAALSRRKVSRKGIYQELALTESLFPHIGPFIGEYSLTGSIPPVLGNRDQDACPHGCYPTRDLEPASDGRQTSDRWIAIACWAEDQWRSLTRMMGRPDLAKDPRFVTAATRKAHEEDLDVLIGEWTKDQYGGELMHALQAAGIPAASVMADSELFEDDHLAARGFFREIHHREAGVFRGPGPIWRSSRFKLDVRLPANCLGEHNRAVFQDMLGLSDAEFSKLEADEVCGDAYTASLAQEGQ